MPQQNAMPAPASTPALTALRDGWFFTAIAGASLLLAVPLLWWVKAEIQKEDPIAVGGVMLASGAVACFLYAAMKFWRALRLGLRERSVIPLVFTTALGLAGLALLVGNHFRSSAVKAGTLGAMLAVALVFIALLPFKKFLQQRMRLALGLLVLAALPLGLFLAAVIEIGLFVRGGADRYFLDPPTFPEYVPSFARKTVADCTSLFVANVNQYAAGSGWLPATDLKAMAVDPGTRDVDPIWWGLMSSSPRDALELALTVPTASPRTIPPTKYDKIAGIFIGKLGSAEQVRARLQGQYSDTHHTGICHGLYHNKRHRQFAPEIAALIELGGGPRVVGLYWYMLDANPGFRDGFLRRHLQSDTAPSRTIIASASELGLKDLSGELFELGLKSSDPNARLLVLYSAHTIEYGPDGIGKLEYKFTKTQWGLIAASAADPVNVSKNERILAMQLLKYLGINVADLWNLLREPGALTPEVEAEIARVVKEARPLIEALKE